MALFGLVAHGRALRTDFVPTSVDKCVMELPSPSSLPDIAVFLLPGVALPPDRGVLIFAGTPATGYTTIGAIHAACPSTIIHTGWPAHPDFTALASIQIALSVEPLDSALAALQTCTASDAASKLSFAQQVAADLYTFMLSFSHVTAQGGEELKLPPDVIDRWYAKYSRRFAAALVRR